jgi:[ribosomal protein S18]-alanine N-acetyltransferase
MQPMKIGDGGTMSDGNISFRALADTAEAQACAQMMAATDPWITLGRDYDGCLRLLTNPAKEVTVAERNGAIDGFVVLDMNGPFAGYIQTLCVRPAAQGQGLGRALIAWAEKRIHRVSPNVYMCVSSFNQRARALYERLGFQYVGTLEDLVVAGYDEILLRKTVGPLSEFRPEA